MNDVIFHADSGPEGPAPRVFSEEESAEGAALLRRGVFVSAWPEDVASLGRFLIRGLGLEPGYPERRIQTILRNGLAVDGMGAPLAHGDRLALSAAMPGVAGAALRRGGPYAALREGITLRENSKLPAPGGHAPLWIELRCFNSIAEELAGHLLARGLAARSADLGPLLRVRAGEPPAGFCLPAPDLVWISGG